MIEVKPGESFDFSEVVECSGCHRFFWEDSLDHLEYDVHKFCCEKCQAHQAKKRELK